MKFGIDIHGVIDKNPELFAALTETLVAASHEVHVITGISWTPAVVDMLKAYNIRYTHCFSVTDSYKHEEAARMRCQ